MGATGDEQGGPYFFARPNLPKYVFTMETTTVGAVMLLGLLPSVNHRDTGEGDVLGG